MGSSEPTRWFGGPHGESEGQPTTTPADTTGRVRVGRRRFLAGVSALGVGLPGVARAGASQGAGVEVEFRDCVTARFTGDVGAITGLHFHVWNAVDAVDDHLLIEDFGALTPGTTLANGLRIKEYDPGTGVLVVVLNTLAYNSLETADVYLGEKPEFFGDGADLSRNNPVAADVALTDVEQDQGAYGDGDVVSADATLVNFGDGQRDVFLGYSAVGPDGLRTRYDERYVHGAFSVGDPVAASIDGVSLPGGTFATDEAVPTDVTVTNTGGSEHTFFVGYSVIGPDGLAYTNGRTTGTPVTLASGESRTVTVDWTVQSGAPRGAYGVHVAVWAEDSPDALETKLDEVRRDAVFEVG